MRIGLEALTSLHRRLWKPRPPPPSCAAMTGEVIGDVTGDVISDAIALTVRRALLSRARRRASAAVAAVAAARFRFLDSFKPKRG